MSLEVSQNSQENTFARASFLIKLQEAWNLTFQKQSFEIFYKTTALENFSIFAGKHLCWNDFSTDVFLWTLRNFDKHPFRETSVNDYSWHCFVSSGYLSVQPRISSDWFRTELHQEGCSLYFLFYSFKSIYGLQWN